MRNTVLAGLLALALPACLVGTGDISSDPGGGGGGTSGGGGDQGGGGDHGGGGGGMQPTPKVAATVDKSTVTTELGKTETVALTITGSDGFTGDVNVAPTLVDAQGAPLTGWTITATPPTVTLTQDGTATVNVDVKVPTDAAELAPTLKLELSSTAAPVEADSAFTIAKQVTLSIDAGAGAATPHLGLPMPNSRLNIRAGTKIVFHNGDTIVHRIHGDGGIQHEGGDLAPGADYTVTVSSNADWYCHDHENGNTDARIVNIVP